MGLVRTEEQTARAGRDRARISVAREVLNWTVIQGDSSAQLAALRKIASEAEAYGAQDGITAAADAWRDGRHEAAFEALAAADEGLSLIAEPFEEERATLLARIASSALGTKIIETGATVNALVGNRTETFSGADAKLVAEAEARAESIQMGGGLLLTVAAILALMYVGSR